MTHGKYENCAITFYKMLKKGYDHTSLQKEIKLHLNQESISDSVIQALGWWSLRMARGQESTLKPGSQAVGNNLRGNSVIAIVIFIY